MSLEIFPVSKISQGPTLLNLNDTSVLFKVNKEATVGIVTPGILVYQ